jgi:archaemetzincin
MSVLYLVPIGDVEESTMKAAASCFDGVFWFDVAHLEAWEEPRFAFDQARSQYSAVAILQRLVERCPADAVRIIGITNSDLFIPMLTLVFGQAQLQGKAAVVSCARLHQEFYGLPPRPALFRARLAKEILHETGHTFGLTHCKDPACVMSLATGITQVDNKGSEFCKGCTALIHERTARLNLV